MKQELLLVHIDRIELRVETVTSVHIGRLQARSVASAARQ
jgi:hypothetical protein